MRNKRIAIVGPGRAGKDTMAEWLGQLTSLSYVGSTSSFSIGICREYLLKHKRIEYADDESAYADRVNYRQEWADAIGEYNTPDRTRLYKKCLESQDILTGIRYDHERQAIVDEGLIDLWVWIDNCRVAHDPTILFTQNACDIVIPNHGTLEEFRKRVVAFAQFADLVAVDVTA